jgi:cyclopropane-fatty-acyl-phospholipid synthase
VNRNTRAGARRNISAHYDLGNEFFALWLDESMMYSSAVYEHPGMCLAEAQNARLDHVCNKLALGPADRVIEIGTGWGGFAVHAASKYGCHVTTTTISREQYEFAARRIEAAGVQDRVKPLLEDYRDLRGTYDKLVSIEMIEAIGWKQFDTYFNKCSELLKPGGEMLIQAITIADQQFERTKRSVDFIQRYIFPGSSLTSVASMSQSIASRTDLQITDLEDIGLNYAQTLRDWRRNFLLKLSEVRDMGYPEAFIRMWEYYFCYCEGGFLERAISDVHLQARKPAY